MTPRTGAYTPDSAIVNVFVFQVAWAFLGEHTLSFCNNRLGLADSIHKSMSVPRVGSVVLAAWFCTLATFLYLETFWTRLRSEQAILVATFLLVAIFTARTALDGIPYSRYALLPGLALLLLAGQSSWPDEVKKWQRDKKYIPAIWPTSWPGHFDWHPTHRK